MMIHNYDDNDGHDEYIVQLKKLSSPLSICSRPLMIGKTDTITVEIAQNCIKAAKRQFYAKRSQAAL